METQKIIKQELNGSDLGALAIAKFTWKKDEIAWYFCNSFRDVFRVQFTGEHWLSGNKWSREKIYQYKYLDTSGRELEYTGDNGNRISHSNEENFYTTKEAAVERALSYINAVKKRALKSCREDKIRIEKYANEKNDISTSSKN